MVVRQVSADDLKRVIDSIVHMASDDDVVVEHRGGPGYETVYMAFSRLRYSHRTEQRGGFSVHAHRA